MECSIIRSARGSTIRNGAKRSPILVIGMLIVSFAIRLPLGAVMTGSPSLLLRVYLPVMATFGYRLLKSTTGVVA
jgi:hypothetical protein